jgi:hypothetical protein
MFVPFAEVRRRLDVLKQIMDLYHDNPMPWDHAMQVREGLLDLLISQLSEHDFLFVRQMWTSFMDELILRADMEDPVSGQRWLIGMPMTMVQLERARRTSDAAIDYCHYVSNPLRVMQTTRPEAVEDWIRNGFTADGRRVWPLWQAAVEKQERPPG